MWSNNWDWLDKGIPPTEWGRKVMKMMVLQGVELVGIKSILHKQDIEFHHKGKAPRKVSSSSNDYNSNNDDDGNNGVVALVRPVEELVAMVVVIMLVK